MIDQNDFTLITVILAAALLTFFTRIGGHVVLSRFSSIHPRVEAALEAVPMAVIAALIAPAAYKGGIAEIAALGLTALATLRLSAVLVVPLGVIALVVLRQMGF